MFSNIKARAGTGAAASNAPAEEANEAPKEEVKEGEEKPNL